VKKDWALTQEAFDRLLTWLDADRDQAGAKYEHIRLSLVKIFLRRGCTDAEELADETINRVTTKLEDIIDTFVGEKEVYFYGIARLIFMEYTSRSHKPRFVLPAEPSKISEEYYACLEECMSKLSEPERDLILKYYQEDKQAKIDNRKALAISMGVPVATLRMRVCRIRDKLKKCMSKRIKMEEDL
jgi:DNA-directed RNA polymerase specialized sigma24 family protein